MSFTLHLIRGPTSTGKTAAAVALAERTGAPVISLDRVQCCFEISTGSGRPMPRELRGTKRIYLCSRKLIQGIIAADEANELLKQRVAECAVSSELVILEGGSVSLLNRMISDPYWERFQWRADSLQLGDPDMFLTRARARVQEMFQHREGEPSLLDELVSLWSDPATHPILEDIDGYRYVIRFAREHGFPVPQIVELDRRRQRQLIEGIAEEYLDHARWQTREFHPLPLSWQGDAQHNEAQILPVNAIPAGS